MNASGFGDGSVTIVGGGLAGSEAARVLAAAGFDVALHEMRPERPTPAHKTGDLAELVCSNSLGSREISTGKGVLLAELQLLGSLVVQAATRHAVPAGNSLAVEREGFARDVTGAIAALERVTVVRGEVAALPRGPTLVATGPLTSESLALSIARAAGRTQLFFYDAIAPIVAADSIDADVVYAATRHGRGEPDFLNCPLGPDDYEHFIDELVAAEKVLAKDFEQERYFEGCMPIEVMADRGRQTLAFGPMRPVGLPDPRTGAIPHAVVQLRREDKAGQLYNLVGFQTKLKYPEQKRVFRLIPGLERAEFVRLGSIHRNTFISTPALLCEDLSLRSRRDLWFAGQIVGCEGYAESAAMGLMAALAMVARARGAVLEPPPRTTMIGGLMGYIRDADPRHFQPMNSNFGLLPAPAQRFRGKGARAAKRTWLAERALGDMAAWIERHDLGWLAAGTPTDESSCSASGVTAEAGAASDAGSAA